MPDNEAILVAANKRSPRNEVARFILADLDSAVTYMEPDGWEATTRISPAVAHLFASRVALFEGSWLTNFAGTPFVPNGEDGRERQKTIMQIISILQVALRLKLSTSSRRRLMRLPL